MVAYYFIGGEDYIQARSFNTEQEAYDFLLRIDIELPWVQSVEQITE